MDRWLTMLMVVLLGVTSAPALAQQSERVRHIEREIQILKKALEDQGRRIELLERAIQGPSQAVEPTAPTGAQNQPPSFSAYPWHDKNSWGRVKDGMSEAQVMSILGRPTSVNTVGGFKTIFYRGEVAGSGSVSGNVKLQDDRVWQVNKPVF
ncbi:MAG: hypothetical protein HYY78_15365 [Betaproteobacteria bacterium]|nr:hypothetical protein [Betaproteobacteria bacterium]